MDWNALLAISTTVMALAIATTAVFALIQLSDIKKTRYSALLMQLIQIWNSNEIIQSRKTLKIYSQEATLGEAASKLVKDFQMQDKNNTDLYYELVRLADFFESLGYLTCNGQLDEKHSLEVFGSAARKHWLVMKEVANYQRTKPDNPQGDMWKYFEYLGKGCNKKDECLKIPVSTD